MLKRAVSSAFVAWVAWLALAWSGLAVLGSCGPNAPLRATLETPEAGQVFVSLRRTSKPRAEVGDLFSSSSPVRGHCQSLLLRTPALRQSLESVICERRLPSSGAREEGEDLFLANPDQDKLEARFVMSFEAPGRKSLEALSREASQSP